MQGLVRPVMLRLVGNDVQSRGVERRTPWRVMMFPLPSPPSLFGSFAFSPGALDSGRTGVSFPSEHAHPDTSEQMSMVYTKTRNS
jgi:hypothetical protein